MTDRCGKGGTGSNTNLRAEDKRSVASLLQNVDQLRTRGGGRRLGIFCLEEECSNPSESVGGESRHFDISDLNGVLEQVDTFCIQLNLKSGATESETRVPEIESTYEFDRKQNITDAPETRYNVGVDRKRNTTHVQETGNFVEVERKRNMTNGHETESTMDDNRKRNVTNVQETRRATEVDQKQNMINVQKTGRATEVDRKHNRSNVQETRRTTELDRKQNRTDVQEPGRAADVDQEQNIRNVSKASNATDRKRSRTKVPETVHTIEIGWKRSETANSGSKMSDKSETPFSDKLRDVEDQRRFSSPEVRLLNNSDTVQQLTDGERVRMTQLSNCQVPCHLLEQLCAELDRGAQIEELQLSRSFNNTMEIPMDIDPGIRRKEPREYLDETILGNELEARRNWVHGKSGETSLMETILENEVDAVQDMCVRTRSGRGKILEVNTQEHMAQSHASRPLRKTDQAKIPFKDARENQLLQTSSRSRSRGQRENCSASVRQSSQSSPRRRLEHEEFQNCRKCPHPNSHYQHEKTDKLKLTAKKRASTNKRIPHSSQTHVRQPVESIIVHSNYAHDKKMETQHAEENSHSSNDDIQIDGKHFSDICDPSDYSFISRSRGWKPVESRNRHTERSGRKKLQSECAEIFCQMSDDDFVEADCKHVSDTHDQSDHCFTSRSRGWQTVEGRNRSSERSRGKKLENQRVELIAHMSEDDVETNNRDVSKSSDHSFISESRGRKLGACRNRLPERSHGKELRTQRGEVISHTSDDDVEMYDRPFADVSVPSGHSVISSKSIRGGQFLTEGFEELTKLEQSVNEIGNLLRACYETIGGKSSKLTDRQVKALLKCSPLADKCSNGSQLHKKSAAVTAHCTGCFKTLQLSKSRDTYSEDGDTLRDSVPSRTSSKTRTTKKIPSAHSAGTFQSHKEKPNIIRKKDLFGGPFRPSGSKVKIIDSKPSLQSRSLSKGSSRRLNSYEELSGHSNSVKTLISSKSSGQSAEKAFGTRFIGVIEEFGSDEDDIQRAKQSMGSVESEEVKRSFSEFAMEVDEVPSDPGVACHLHASESSTRPSIQASRGACGRRGALTPHEITTAAHGARGVACVDPKRHSAFQRRIDELKRTICDLQVELCTEQNNWQEELQAMQETVSNYEKLGEIFHEFL